MKCAKCGAEMKEGCIYCSVCGNEAQIVPDYSVLEDDYLRSLLKDEETPRKRGEQSQVKKNVDGRRERQQPPKKKMSNKVPIFVVCGILVILIAAGIIVKVTIDHRNANSYDYQVEMAEKESVDRNYENALQYYKAALSLKPDDIAVRMAMTDIYMEQKEYDAAMVLLMEIIKLDDANQKAYEYLIRIYEDEGQYEQIIELADDVSDEKLAALFADYLVDPPVISPEEGKYQDYVDVTIDSPQGYDIYYTLDGSEPDEVNGIYYKDEIALEEAETYEIAAACVNEKGIWSEPATATFKIELLAPEYATVLPDGGRIEDITFATIEAEEGCSIYYTWDGTDPTTASPRYDTPLEIPTGNNVLSVLVVNDKTGLDSGVYRTNFIYYP